MTVLRCTTKLLKRLRHTPRLAEPAPQANPLDEWYADIDSWRRQPFIVLLNGATGCTLVLPGHAAGLRQLHEGARLQFAALCTRFQVQGPAVDAELRGFDAGFACGNTRDRSLLASLNQRKWNVWMRQEHGYTSLFETAAMEWDGLFKHPALGRDLRYNMDHHRPLDLLRQRLAQPPNEGVATH